MTAYRITNSISNVILTSCVTTSLFGFTTIAAESPDSLCTTNDGVETYVTGDLPSPARAAGGGESIHHSCPASVVRSSQSLSETTYTTDTFDITQKASTTSIRNKATGKNAEVRMY